MLFLGAGASRAVGIEDLQGITQIIRQRLPQNLRSLVDRLGLVFQDEKYNSLNLQLDLEILYTVFDNLVHRREALRELGPFAVIMDDLLENNESLRSLQITEEEFLEFQQIVSETIFSVMNNYRDDQTNRRRAIELYDNLFEIGRDHGQFITDAREADQPRFLTLLQL